MIGDRTYDSDPFQQRYGVQLIAPHKFVRVAPATQDRDGSARMRCNPPEAFMRWLLGNGIDA